MKTPRHQVAALLSKRSLSSSLNKSRLSRSIAAYLLETGRTSELSSLMRDVMQDRADEGIIEVKAVSAFELTPMVESNIKTEIRRLYPKAKQIIIDHVQDPDVIGGVRLEFANEQLDLSLRSKLNRFKQLTVLGETK